MKSFAAGSVRGALGAAADALAAAGVDSPRLDAELLLAEATDLARADLLADPDAGVPASAGRAFGQMVRRRLRREPVAYILGRRGFRRIELAVDGRVLIPRPETELLVEVAVELAPRRLLDVGTGSGAVALAVADELPDCLVTATDTSGAALEVARANAARLGLAWRVRFLEGTIPVGPDRGGVGGGRDDRPGNRAGEEGFDLVVANLPYVAERDWASLPAEIREWEPREALLSGPDGLDAYRALAPRLSCRTSSRYAATSATATAMPVVALEVGEGQAGAVGEMLREAGFPEIEKRRDLAGIERVVVGRPGLDRASGPGHRASVRGEMSSAKRASPS
jgi:release factor glutamine methyltransferase